MKTLALLLLSISCAFGQTNTTIETAFELEFDSSPGVLYAIEASADMVTWQQIDKVYGAADRTPVVLIEPYFSDHPAFRNPILCSLRGSHGSKHSGLARSRTNLRRSITNLVGKDRLAADG